MVQCDLTVAACIRMNKVPKCNSNSKFDIYLVGHACLFYIILYTKIIIMSNAVFNPLKIFDENIITICLKIIIPIWTH